MFQSLFFFGNKHCQRFNTYHGLKYMIGAEQLDQSIDVVARNVIEFKHSCWNRWNLRERSQSVILSQAVHLRLRPSVQLRPNLQSFFYVIKIPREREKKEAFCQTFCPMIPKAENREFHSDIFSCFHLFFAVCRNTL